MCVIIGQSALLDKSHRSPGHLPVSASNAAYRSGGAGSLASELRQLAAGTRFRASAARCGSSHRSFVKLQYTDYGGTGAVRSDSQLRVRVVCDATERALLAAQLRPDAVGRPGRFPAVFFSGGTGL